MRGPQSLPGRARRVRRGMRGCHDRQHELADRPRSSPTSTSSSSNKGYGCNAEITTGDTVPTITSMVEKGQPDIAPEGWVDLLPDVVKRGLDEGRIIRAR